MECADRLEGGFDPAQARFLMVTAITHHRLSSPAWGEHEIRRLHAKLTEIDVSAAQVLGSRTRSSRLENAARLSDRAGRERSFRMTAARRRLPQIGYSRGR